MSKKLSDAAAAILKEESAEQIFNSNISAKNAKQDKFGQGKKITADEQGEQDLGKAGETDGQAYKNPADLQKQVSFPGLDKGEPMHKLAPQPGETEGRKDLMPSALASEIEDSPHDKEHVDRKKGNMHKETGFTNKGAIKPYVPESEDEEDFETEEASEEEVLDDVENMEESVFAEKYGMSKTQALDYMYEESEAECAANTKKAEKKKAHYSMKVKEDMDALFSGETLSEEFKDKAAVIFEAAVQTRVDDIKTELEESYAAEFESAVETIVEDIASKMDSYLDYVVENWMAENEIAISKGLRTEIAEDFIGALRDVFVEHHIDVPEEKVDLVEGLVEKIETLETKLNEEISKNVEFKHQIAEHKKQDIIHDICEGLTLSQSEKIKSLAENVEFKSNEDFANKLGIIKESYFPSNAGIVPASSEALNEEIEFDEDTSTKAVDPLIDSYAKKIAQLNKF
jgi:hypothetical protein